MRNTGLVEAQARRDINNLRNADDTTLRAESDEEIKRHFMKVKEASEKVGLKLNLSTSPVTSWQIDGKTVEIVADFIFGLQNHCKW